VAEDEDRIDDDDLLDDDGPSQDVVDEAFNEADDDDADDSPLDDDARAGVDESVQEALAETRTLGGEHDEEAAA
jgi:hypothetical protein